MKYQVVSAKTCPYVQRILILLKEKGVDYSYETIELKTSQHDLRHSLRAGKPLC